MQVLKQIQNNLISHALNYLKIRHLFNKILYFEISPQLKLELNTKLAKSKRLWWYHGRRKKNPHLLDVLRDKCAQLGVSHISCLTAVL